MKALFLNGSPRKNFNTVALLKKAMEGAKSLGAETELVHLYDYEFTGCKSCFACKIKGSKCNGLCAIKDSIRPVLEKAFEADIIVIGSPIYFSYPTGQVRNFLERLLFPIDTYLVDENDGHRIKVPHKTVHTACIYTMNCPKDWLEKVGYYTILGRNTEEFGRLMGTGEELYSCDTYQFNNYDRYDVNMFKEEAKRKQRDEQFPKDEQAAYELGVRLAQKAIGTVKEEGVA
ncbi:MAG: flavodoxin family protein [Lachnospiraceae bacterium]|nr:flavodoxin family protein [Lachnospiraceae bacterium]